MSLWVLLCSYYIRKAPFSLVVHKIFDSLGLMPDEVTGWYLEQRGLNLIISFKYYFYLTVHIGTS